MDLEVAFDHNLEEQKDILLKLANDMKAIQLPLTVFTTSEAADRFSEEIKILKETGNEIGCHGLNHRSEENYKKLNRQNIEDYILSATLNIERKLREKPVSFRGPGMTTSAKTQEVLINNGYETDFSVCPQRIDLFNSTGGTLRWITSPRTPYNPGKNPFVKGKLPIWVIPLSCIGLPFISGTLYLLGLNFMKLFFRVLLKEAVKFNKPIVYLFHSYEFSSYINKGKKPQLQTNRRKLIHRFYLKDHFKRYEMNLSLLKFMLSFDSVLPVTGKNYASFLKDNTA
jgi:hypothetical protein